VNTTNLQFTIFCQFFYYFSEQLLQI